MKSRLCWDVTHVPRGFWLRCRHRDVTTRLAVGVCNWEMYSISLPGNLLKISMTHLELNRMSLDVIWAFPLIINATGK